MQQKKLSNTKRINELNYKVFSEQQRENRFTIYLIKNLWIGIVNNIFSIIAPFLLAFAAGAMIYVVVQELIPESQSNKKKNVMALFTLIGFSIMMILDVAFG